MQYTENYLSYLLFATSNGMLTQQPRVPAVSPIATCTLGINSRIRRKCEGDLATELQSTVVRAG